jgi:CheY-like chemotaxis protein
MEASNGLEAIKVVEKCSDPISLVVLDLSMPVMSGDECLKRLTEIKPDLPVILSSGFNEAEAVQRFRAEGIKGFLQKPYTASRLAESLKQALSRAVRRGSA